MKIVPQNNRILATEIEQTLADVKTAEGTGAELYRFRQFKVESSEKYKKGTVVYAPEYVDKMYFGGTEYRIMHESDVVASIEK